MEKMNKNQLLELARQQESKIQRYESRLRDLIGAYKGIQKEKEALESSLHALNDTSRKRDVKGHSEEECKEDDLPGEPEERDEEKVVAVTKALATLTEEKNRIEAGLLADKKKLKQEQDDLLKQLCDQHDEHQQERNKLAKEIQELKLSLRNEQRHREQEQQDHVVMLRELQQLLSQERATREKLEMQLEDWRKSQDSQSKIPERRVEEYEKCIRDLRNELRQVRERLRAAENKANQPSPLLLQLQKEMMDMKSDHQKAVEEEQKRANAAEEKEQKLALGSELRVSSLEARLSELSEMVGNYDRLRQQDQIAIAKLKERVTQLDLENTALTTVAGLPKQSYSKEETNVDVNTLTEKIRHLHGLLKQANDRSEKPINIKSVLNFEPEEDLHERCQEELQQLKDEFENYKARAQTVLKNRSVKDFDSSKELDYQRNQVTELKSKLHSVQGDLETSKKQRQSLEDAIQALKQHHRQELTALELESTGRMVELEQQAQKQRERTMALLLEKEEEIALLKSATFGSTLLQKYISDSPSPVGGDGKHSPRASSEDRNSDSLTDILSQGMKEGKHQLLYYVQEIARRDVEINGLRRSRHQAETSLRELQQATATKEDAFVEDLEIMQAKIHRLESSQNEKGINMEYLKNIVLRFFLCQSVDGQVHILNAIATILHFTPRELSKARYHLYHKWW